MKICKNKISNKKFNKDQRKENDLLINKIKKYFKSV